MAPPAAKCPTTVLDLDDGLLREVFLRLPALPSLVRAALSCRTFLRAVRSSPAFRRRFRELHPSPFVGLFIQRLLKCLEPEVASFDAHHCRPDRDFEAAVRGGDFSLAGLPLPDGDNQDRGDGDDMDEDDEEEEEDEDASPVWEIERCCDGYVVLFNRRAQQIAAYNPLTQALHLFPTPPGVFSDAVNYEFHIIYWTHVGKPYITVLDTTTLQFTKMDLPPLLVGQKGRECAFVLGNTKDGRPCIVSPDLWGGCSLDVFFWRRDDEDYDDGLNYWILDKTFPLKTIRRFIKFSEGDDEFIILRLLDVIDGIVYLRTEYDGCAEAPQLLLSFCLETAELKMICEDYHKPVHPYIMAWPPSLVVLDKGPCSKDEALSTPGSEGSDVKAGGGPTPTEPASVAKA